MTRESLNHSPTLSLFFALCLTACSDGAENAPAANDTSSDFPSDVTQEGLVAFLSEGTYVDWASDSEGPREETTTLSPHNRVRVHYNLGLRRSHAQGLSPHAVGSMAVKELYSELDQIIGHAVMLRNDDGWLYYCIAEEAGRCFSSSQPNAAHYSKATTSCSCHGLGTIVSVDSIPPP